MNDKDTKRKLSSKKKNGFYFALYSGIGVILLIAVVLGYNNLGRGTEDITPKNNPMAITNEEPRVAEVNKSNDPQIPQTDIGTAISSDQDSSIVITKKPAATPMPPVTEPPSQTPAPAPARQTNSAPAPTQSEGTNNPDSQSVPKSEEKPKDSAQLEAVTDSGNKENFTAYNGDEKMSWPLVGEIVMPFSMDALVYDKTLEQFRTNESISISAPAGTQVKAAADGIVTNIINTKELGNTVVINHGNGWVTTYSQLQDNILVGLDDVVKAGQVIGGVGEPSIYSVLLGNHLQFEVLKDDVAMNPNEILASNE